ncbi:MAG: hypothetical protein HN404_03835 [Gemmatimonadetes bacterium]|nr:hypothetical protein [Gemmatimonadota bacterium]
MNDVTWNDVWTTGGYVDLTTDGDDVFIARSDHRLIGRSSHDQGSITAAGAISSASAGGFFAVEDGHLTHWGHRRYSNTAINVDVGADGRVYFVGADNRLYRHQNELLSPTATAKAIAGGPNGEVYFVGDDDRLYRLESGPTPIATITALDVDIRDDGVVFFIDGNGQVFRYNPADGNGAVAVWGGARYDLRHIAVRGNIVAVGNGNDVIIAQDPFYLPPGLRGVPPSTFEDLGQSELPTDFAIETDVTINASESFGRIFEIGFPEHGNAAPLRLQALDEGRWYISVGDGVNFSDEHFEGHWTFGTPFKLRVTYDHQSTHTSVYENGERVFTYSPVPVPSGKTGTVVLGGHGAAARGFNAQVTDFQIIPPSTFETLEPSTTLPTDFAIEADVTINWSESFGKIIEIGYPEHGNAAPLRLQALDEGRWYISVGDGVNSNDEHFEGHWTFGTPFKLRVTYDHQSTHTSVYENGERVFTYSPVPVPSGKTGTVVLGHDGAAAHGFNAQVSDFRMIPTSTFEDLGQSDLQANFTIEADVTINWSESFGKIIEIGYPEHGNAAPFRLQALHEGRWYIAVGDGVNFSDEFFEGHWTFGTPFRLRVTYDPESTHTSVYENDERVFTYSPAPVPSGMRGTVVLGDDGATARGFNAQVSDFQITSESVWSEVTGSASKISVGSNGTVWTVGRGNDLTVWRGSGSGTDWEKMGLDDVYQIAGSPNGTAFVVKQDRTIQHFDGSEWFQIDGVASDISVGSDGTVWTVGRQPYGAVWRDTGDGRGWQEMGLPDDGAVQVDGGPDGTAYVVKQDHTIWHFDGSTWFQIDGLASDISVGSDGTVWTVGTRPRGAVYRGSGNGRDWESMGPDGAAQIDCGPDGTAYVVNQDGSILKYGR